MNNSCILFYCYLYIIIITIFIGSPYNHKWVQNFSHKSLWSITKMPTWLLYSKNTIPSLSIAVIKWLHRPFIKWRACISLCVLRREGLEKGSSGHEDLNFFSPVCYRNSLSLHAQKGNPVASWKKMTWLMKIQAFFLQSLPSMRRRKSSTGLEEKKLVRED